MSDGDGNNDPSLQAETGGCQIREAGVGKAEQAMGMHLCGP